MHERKADLNGWSVDLKFLEDGKGLLIQLIANGNVGYVWGIVVVKAVDVLHDTCTVSLDGSLDQQILQIPEKWTRGQGFIKEQQDAIKPPEQATIIKITKIWRANTHCQLLFFIWVLRDAKMPQVKPLWTQ